MRNLGKRTESPSMNEALRVAAMKNLAAQGMSLFELSAIDTFTIHHYTDSKDYLQLECETRTINGNVKFFRLKIVD